MYRVILGLRIRPTFGSRTTFGLMVIIWSRVTFGSRVILGLRDTFGSRATFGSRVNWVYMYGYFWVKSYLRIEG